GLIWKAQAGWPSLRGFLYDNYLEQTGGFFGVRNAAERLHVQLNLATLAIEVVNNTRSMLSNASVRQAVCNKEGRIIPKLSRTFAIPDVPGTSIVKVGSISDQIDPSIFHLLQLSLIDSPPRKTGTLGECELVP
ncbi:MAG TPA: hypothetical protein VIS99_16505, partial [Terrimicrobiaceae bacterium]